MSGGTAVNFNRLAVVAALAWALTGHAAPGAAAGPAARNTAGAVAPQVAALPGYLADGTIRAGSRTQGAGPVQARPVTLADIARDHAWRLAAVRRLDRLLGKPRNPPRRRALFLP
jgi:hypothetical protein